MLSKLLDNAIQYTPEGGQIVVAIDKEIQPPQDANSGPSRVEKSGALATIKVPDTGWGIPEEEQEHVLDRFFRREKARSMQVSGTGLGLALAPWSWAYTAGA